MDGLYPAGGNGVGPSQSGEIIRYNVDSRSDIGPITMFLVPKRAIL